jgi:molecular chaperone DnaK
MDKGYGIGIDFGTTNSVLSVFDKRIWESQPSTNINTKLPHPSVVWYKADGTKKVGEDAKKHIMGFSSVTGNHFESSIKRRLGKSIHLNIFGRRFEAWETASHIFEFILSDAKKRGENLNITEAIVTVPVYFNGPARRDLRKAANAAGIYIKTFVHEPFAAIVGHYARSGHLDTQTLKNQHIMVFDWGGGTLDITLVKVDERGLVELANGGISDRAGDHFDEELMNYSRNAKLESLGADPTDLDFSPGDRDRLRAECERAKISLSDRDLERIQVAQACRYRGEYQKIDQPISRAEFDALIEIDVSHAVSEVRRIFEITGVNSNTVDTVLLIGGSSRISLIRTRLREIFGHRLVDVKNANTIIAEGAAIIDALGLHPVLSRSISVELSDGTFYEIFKSGIPATSTTCNKKLNFYCTDNRDGYANLIITDELDNMGSVGRQTKEIIPIKVSADLPKPYNHERVTVEFLLDDDLILKVVGKGATKSDGITCELHDLCFGLNVEEIRYGKK